VTVRAAAVCPATPLLCPDVAVTRDGVGAVQDSARAAVTDLLATRPDAVVVLGEAPETRTYDGTWDWRGFGVPVHGSDAGALPRALGVGAWLLDDAGWAGGRRYDGVATGTSPAACADLGDALRRDGRSLGLLVIGDGSARRSLKAPGHLDPRGEPFDNAVADALARADTAALAALDADLARDLLAAGRAPWQVLAAAAADQAWHSRLRLHEAPYGVGWLVASWRASSRQTF
jgi:hypothetical protein